MNIFALTVWIKLSFLDDLFKLCLQAKWNWVPDYSTQNIFVVWKYLKCQMVASVLSSSNGDPSVIIFLCFVFLSQFKVPSATSAIITNGEFGKLRAKVACLPA